MKGLRGVDKGEASLWMYCMREERHLLKKECKNENQSEIK